MDGSYRLARPEGMARQKPCLTKLPVELLWDIASYMSIREVSFFMRTNKKFSETLYPQIIKQAIQEDDKIHKSTVNLRSAAMKDNLGVFEEILAQTKAALLTDNSIKGGEYDQDDPVYKTNTVHEATIFYKPIYLQKILAKGVDVNVLDERDLSAGNTAIQLAAKYNRLENMKVLIDFGANVNDQVNGNHQVPNWTPLHRATARRNFEMVKFLISAGADTSVRMGSNLDTTILIRALKWTKGLQLILGMHKFEEPVLTDALTHAVRDMTDFYHPAVCLIKAGGIPHYQLLCIACKRESMPTFQSVELIAKYATADDRDEGNLTALHEVMHGNIAHVVARTIPDIVNAEGRHGYTPLQYLYGVYWPSQLREVAADPCLQQRRSDIALALIQKGARLDFVLGPYKRNVIFFACDMGHDLVVEYLLDKDEMLAESRDTLGNTPLHMAASSWDDNTLDCMGRLLEAGADVHAQNDQGQTALHCTSSPILNPHAPPRTYLDVDYTCEKVVALTDSYADIFLRGTRDWSLTPRTPLVEAIFTSNIVSAEVLVKKATLLLPQSKQSQNNIPDKREIRKYLTEALHASVENGYMDFFNRMLQSDTECSLEDLAPNGDNIFHCLARGAIANLSIALAMVVGWRILGYKMPPDWDYPFQGTDYTAQGRPQRHFHYLADQICQETKLLPLALEKNAAGYSAFDLYKQAFPTVNWEAILEKVQTSLSKGVDVFMPNNPYQNTVDLTEDYDMWTRDGL
ncbi:uncharacterized protein TRUGW13939_04702 [Talaromyces rugulosus]|uniref:Uncharacterized protein n=1 Tax=Talaromyces rugulosus TaxID=121627 RepID=A0A7H8QUA1_TALRU|nr:uncharacterized protein TRUGW13939_04702 [Talaromyces rugulosus]QKX57584.1 hypothetical protein TRUGW13939_04702 [Talaromyces rugulosus]